MKARREVVDGIEYISFICPGCSLRAKHDYFHSIDTNGKIKWKWNGSLSAPTFEPSVLFWLEHRPDEDEEEKRYVDAARCHSFVREGRIEFLSDCGHALAGKTVDLPELSTPEVSTTSQPVYDVGNMEPQQYEVLKDWEVTDEGSPFFGSHAPGSVVTCEPNESILSLVEQGVLKLLAEAETLLDGEKTDTAATNSTEQTQETAQTTETQTETQTETKAAPTTPPVSTADATHPDNTKIAEAFPAAPKPFDGSVEAISATPVPGMLYAFGIAITHHEAYFAPGENKLYPAGTRSFHDKNPGNLKFANQIGAIAEDKDSFAVFPPYEPGPDYAIGFMALIRQIELCIRGTNAYKATVYDVALKSDRPQNFQDFFNVYAPVKDHNDPVAYCADVCAEMSKVSGEKITPDMPLAILIAA